MHTRVPQIRRAFSSVTSLPRLGELASVLHPLFGLGLPNKEPPGAEHQGTHNTMRLRNVLSERPTCLRSYSFKKINWHGGSADVL